MTTPADALSAAEAASSSLLAQAADAGMGTGETVAFWILAPISVAGALGMVFSRSAVHSALWLVLTMLALGAMYMVQQAPFLGFVQILVYTGAIMMLFLFVLMLVGRESSDSVIEVLRGQRVAALVAGIGFAGLLIAAVANSLVEVTPAGLAQQNLTGDGNVGNIGELLFTEYLYPFELTSALLITGALGAMVLSFSERERRNRPTQRTLVEARLRGEHARPSPLPGPGVFATGNSVATPALLPDGSVSEDSLSEIIETTARERLEREAPSLTSPETDYGARTLRGPEPPTGSDQQEPQ